jgi:hypothetical protein
MAEWYLSDEPLVLICVKNSYSCNFGLFVKSGDSCTTKQLDFGSSYLKWVGIFRDGKYCGAHPAINFMLFGVWRSMRIDQILED